MMDDRYFRPKAPSLADQLAGTMFDGPTQDEIERAERDRIMAEHEAGKPDLLETLRQHARDVFAREQRPVSVNDVRALLKDQGFDGDRRVLGQVFNTRGWRRVGVIETKCEGATVARVGVARSLVGCYVPADAEWQGAA